MADVTEIRVHGVSGTPPRYMLRTDPLLKWRRPKLSEDGDATGEIDDEGDSEAARKKRKEQDRLSPVELSIHARDVPDHDVIAYNWSKLTSGRKKHAFWLFLLPYTLLNAAGWMLPPREREDGVIPAGGLSSTKARWADVFIRVSGGIVTGLFIVFTLGILLDLVGKKCQIGTDRCDVLDLPWEFSPGAWLFVGTLIALVITAVIGVGIGLEGGRKSQSQMAMARFKAAGGDPKNHIKAEVKGESDPAALLTLDDPTFWQHRPLTTYLVLTHMGIAALIAGWVLSSIHRHTDGISYSFYTSAVATIVVFTILILASSTDYSSATPRLAWTALVVGVASWLAAAVDALSLSDAGWSELRVEAGLSQTAVVLTAIITAIGLGIWIPSFRKNYSTSGTAAMIVLGGLMGSAFGAGAYTLVHRALAASAEPGTIEPLAGMDWPALLFLTYLLMLIGAAVITMARDELELEEPLYVTEGVRNVTTKVRGLLGWPAGFTLIGTAGFVVWSYVREGVELESPFVALDDLTRVMLVVLSLAVLVFVVVVVKRFFSLLIAVIAALAIAAGYVAISAGWVTEFSLLGATIRFDSLREIALSLALLVPVGFVTSRLFSMVRSREQRRGIAILWDLGSFWPRWYHPFGAPTYGPVGVPDLAALVLEKSKDGGVVLAAHSQGSVISMSALLMIPPDHPQWDNIAYLTYGNPVCHLYSRLFGGHFTDEAISKVAKRLGGAAGGCTGPTPDSGSDPRWRNLWRQSDPIGGDICIPGVQSVALTEDVEDGHSGYEKTQAFKKARDSLKARI